MVSIERLDAKKRAFSGETRRAALDIFGLLKTSKL
jgi:hypothetical protein